ncbi:MAG: hypothetical protein IKY66_05290 [Bacteroidales bacterium]|nr:hypothetical protein [Bacteroidales bacterium]
MKVYIVFEQFYMTRFVGIFSSWKSAERFVIEKYGNFDCIMIHEYEVRE